MNRPIRWKPRPYSRALYSSMAANADHPASWTDLAMRVRASPLTARSSTATAWLSRISVVESWWWNSRRASATCAWARATFTRALSRFLLPFCLRDKLRCARLSFFSARRRNCGEAIFRPSDSTAKWVRPRSMPITGPVPGRADGSGLDDETGEVPARGIPDHGDAGRDRRQVAGPADRHVPDPGQPQLPAGQHLEPGVGREPDRLPVILAGLEARRPGLRAFPLPGDRREEIPVRRVQVRQGLLEHHSGNLAQPCPPRGGLRCGQPGRQLAVGEVGLPGRMRLLPGAEPVVEHHPRAPERPRQGITLAR